MFEILSFDQFRSSAKEGQLVPVYKKFLADLDTPVSVFLKIRSHFKYPFLFESVEGGENIARYSFIGFESVLNFKSYDKKFNIDFFNTDWKKRISIDKNKNPVNALKKLLANIKFVETPNIPRLGCGAVGYIGYDTIRLIEKLPDIPNDDLALPDIDLGVYTGVIVFDNLKHQLIIISSAFIDNKKNLQPIYKKTLEKINQIEKFIRSPINVPEIDQRTKQDWLSNFTQHEFEERIEKAKEYIYAGDIFQVVLSQRFSTNFNSDPFDIYRLLRILNPSPYMYFIDRGDLQLVGSSPEMLIRSENGMVETRPIAGTRPRGQNDQEDKHLAQELLNDEKERAEHIMLVDLGRNDIGKISETGSVELTEFMNIERYSHVMHIVSRVKGKLKKSVNPVDAFFACFPAGTVSGAPKIRAMEIIDEFESVKRGIYAGAIGYFDFSGNMDWCIGIRTVVVNGGKVFLQAGAGIVADSIAKNEYLETCNKAKVMKLAITQNTGKRY